MAVDLPAGYSAALGGRSMCSTWGPCRAPSTCRVWPGARARCHLPFSYDPGSTHLQILIGVSILSAFLAARLGGPPRLKPIAVATVVSAVLIGLVGFAHQAGGVRRRYSASTRRDSPPPACSRH